MSTICDVQLCDFETFIKHPGLITKLDDILEVGFNDGQKHLFSDFLTASFDKKPDMTALFLKNNKVIGMGTLFFKGNQIILENLCVKYPKSGDFAYFLKTLFQEIIYGEKNVCDLMYTLNYKNPEKDHFYIVSYVDSQSGNCENLKAINTMCQVNDTYICNYLTKHDGYSKRDFPNLKMEWEPEYYDYAFVVHVNEGEIVPRLEKHIDPETRALLAMNSSSSSSSKKGSLSSSKKGSSSSSKKGRQNNGSSRTGRKLVNPKYSMPPKVSSRPSSPARSSARSPARSPVKSPARGTPQSVRSTRSNDDTRVRTPNGRYASSPQNKKRSYTPNTPNTPNSQSSPVTRGSDKKKSRR